MANTAATLLTPSMITKEILVRLENQLNAAKRVRRDLSSKFAGGSYGFKIGDTITVRKPNRFVIRTGADMIEQDISEPSVAVQVNVQAGVDFSFTMKDLTLTIEEFGDRYADPAAATIANKIDYDVLQLFKDVSSQLGTPRVAPATISALLGVRRRLNDRGAPMEDRTLILDPAAEVALAAAFSAQFNPTAAISEMFKEGQLARIAGLDIYMDQNVGQQTTGTVSNTTPALSATPAEGATTFAMSGLNGATVTAKKGDTFTVANVYAVNPQSRQTTNVLQQFVVTADYTASGSAFAALPIAPAPRTTGPFQNVNRIPTSGDLVTFFDPSAGTSTQNLAFCKDAFALVTVPLDLPRGVHFAARETYKGINLRMIQQYTISNDRMPCRLDVLYGVKTMYEELAVRLVG